MIYTVEAIRGTQDWVHPEGGQMIDYILALRDVALPVEIAQKPTSPPPTVGQQIDLDLKPHPKIEGRMRGKRVQQVPGGGAQGGGFAPGRMDPERERRIVRQHSQEMALHYFALKGECPPSDALVPLINWFQKDAMEGGG
jgi:hypothetical protein